MMALILIVAVYWLWLDYTVRERFAGSKWELAARIYSRPLELYAGAPVSKRMLQLELEGLNYQSVERISGPGQVRWQGSTVTIQRRAYGVGEQQTPEQTLTVQFTGSDGQATIASLDASTAIASLEPKEIGAIQPASGEDRILTRLQDIPPLLGETLIAVEDRNFLHHHGISFRAVARALLANIQAGGVVQGGSTLTQQLVKNLFLTNERNLGRKVTEALMTLSLEWHFSKSEILEAYLNEVYLGQSGVRAVHGFALAARFYFNKAVGDLSTQEIALLVGLAKGASYYDPWRHPERALGRRETVLDVMRQSELISPQEHNNALKAPLGLVDTPQSQHAYPAFVALVKQQLLRDYPLKSLQSEGLQIYTTLAPSVQHMAEQALAEQIERLERQYKLPAESLQGAFVMTSVGSGEIQAVVGDRNPRYHGFNRALSARRAVGSLVKPALYLTALQQGYTLASMVDDAPVDVALDSGDHWRPENFSGVDHGQVPLYLALAKSYNQSAARTGLDAGVNNVLQTLQSLGVPHEFAPLPSVLLGAIELSPMDVSNYYHTLANDGIFTPLRAIRAVYHRNGERLNRYPLASKTVVSAEHAYLIDFALQITAHQGTVQSLYQSLPETLALAGKTGTTNDQRDSWFAGYSGSDLGVVWLGSDDNRSLPLTGATGALTVWRELLQDMPTLGIDRIKPEAVQFVWIDSTTGLLSDENCRGAVLLPFIEGTEPSHRSRCDRIGREQRFWWQRFWR